MKKVQSALKRSMLSPTVIAGLAIVIVAGGYALYQKAGASLVGRDSARNVSSVELGAVSAAQTFSVNSANQSGVFASMDFTSNTKPTGTFVAELRNYTGSGSPAAGTVVATSATGGALSVTTDASKITVAATDTIALANGQYAMVILPQPYSSADLKVGGPKGAVNSYQYSYLNNKWTQVNKPLAYTLNVTNAKKYEPFASGTYSVSENTTGSVHRAGVQFIASATGVMRSIDIAIANPNDTTKRPNPKSLSFTLYERKDGTKLDKGKKVGSASFGYWNADSVNVNFEKLNVAEGKAYVLVISQDPKTAAGTPTLDLKTKAGDTTVAYAAPAALYDNGYADAVSGAYTWTTVSGQSFMVTQHIAEQ